MINKNRVGADIVVVGEMGTGTDLHSGAYAGEYMVHHSYNLPLFEHILVVFPVFRLQTLHRLVITQSEHRTGVLQRVFLVDLFEGEYFTADNLSQTVGDELKLDADGEGLPVLSFVLANQLPYTHQRRYTPTHLPNQP